MQGSTMERRQLLIIHIIFSILLAFTFTVYKGYDFGLFITLFLIILAGSTLPFLYCGSMDTKESSK